MADECSHDKRFSGVFDLPKEADGCLACALEIYASKLDTIEAAYLNAAATADARGDRLREAESRLDAILKILREPAALETWGAERERRYDRIANVVSEWERGVERRETFDEQIERDASAGKLDDLRNEAIAALKRGDTEPV